MKKRTLLILSSFAVIVLLFIGGPAVLASKTDDMSGMMNAMNSPEGKRMMDDCTKFMDKYGDR